MVWAAAVASPLTSPASGGELVLCGDHKVFIVNSYKAIAEGNYRNAILWVWDAWDAAKETGITQSKLNHISECKITDEGNILATSSYGWCMIIERTTKKILFYTPSTPNAHSATVLPGGVIAVATSTGTDTNNNSILLFKPGKPATLLASYPLESAHGVYWHPTLKKLFALGGRTLQVYNFSTSQQNLSLQYEVTTPLSGTHDLTAIDPNRLCISGKESYIYNIDQKSFRSQPLLFNHTAIKSVNVNPTTGELWYTDAIDGDGTQTWSTRTIHWGSDRYGNYLRSFKVPDQDIYKVRVAKWP